MGRQIGGADLMYDAPTGSGAGVEELNAGVAGRVLVIDDDHVFGGFVAAALGSRGHDVDWAGSVADGLATLYGSRYDLVLVDLQLPDGNGFELLRTATDSGLLSGSAAIILTGHDFEEPSDIRVLRKTQMADLDVFLDRIGVIVAITRRRRATAPRVAARSVAKDGGSTARARGVVELVLYTSSASEKCQRALRLVQGVLREFDADRVRLTVRDLAADPEAGDEDAVVFTPTLVKRSPGARTYIVGNLDEASIVADLLTVNGVKRRTQA